jgi:hypothetical protein
MTWPLFLKGVLGFQCAAAEDPRDSPVCADGASYLLNAIHIGAASVVALIIVLIAAGNHRRRGSRVSRAIFGSTALTGPALIVFVVLDSPPVDFAPAVPSLAIACAVAALSVAAAIVSARRTSRCLAAAAAIVAVAGVGFEAGVASPVLAAAAIALAVSFAPPNPA